MWGEEPGSRSRAESNSGSSEIEPASHVTPATQQNDSYLTSKWSQTAKFLRDLTRRKEALADEIKRHTTLPAVTTPNERAAAVANPARFEPEPPQQPAQEEEAHRGRPAAADIGGSSHGVQASLDWLLQRVIQRSSAVSTKLVKSCVLRKEEEMTASRVNSRFDMRSGPSRSGPSDTWRLLGLAPRAASIIKPSDSSERSGSTGRGRAGAKGTRMSGRMRRPALPDEDADNADTECSPSLAEHMYCVAEQPVSRTQVQELPLAARAPSPYPQQELPQHQRGEQQQQEGERRAPPELRLEQAPQHGGSAPTSPTDLSPAVPALPPVVRSVSSPQMLTSHQHHLQQQLLQQQLHQQQQQLQQQLPHTPHQPQQQREHPSAPGKAWATRSSVHPDGLVMIAGSSSRSLMKSRLPPPAASTGASLAPAPTSRKAFMTQSLDGTVGQAQRRRASMLAVPSGMERAGSCGIPGIAPAELQQRRRASMLAIAPGMGPGGGNCMPGGGAGAGAGGDGVRLPVLSNNGYRPAPPMAAAGSSRRHSVTNGMYGVSHIMSAEGGNEGNGAVEGPRMFAGGRSKRSLMERLQPTHEVFEPHTHVPHGPSVHPGAQAPALCSSWARSNTPRALVFNQLQC